MAKIAYVFKGGIKNWICTFNGGTALRYSEHIADAAEFVDDAAITAFLAGKDNTTVPATFANGQLVSQTAGSIHYGLRQH